MNPGQLRRADAAVLARIRADPAYLPESYGADNVARATKGQAVNPETWLEAMLPAERPLTEADCLLLCGYFDAAQLSALGSFAAAYGIDVWLLEQPDPVVALALIDTLGITLCNGWPSGGAGIQCIDLAGESRQPEQIGWLAPVGSDHLQNDEKLAFSHLSVGYLDQEGWVHVLGEPNNRLLQGDLILTPFEGARRLETHPRVTGAALLAVGEEEAARLGLSVGFFAVAEISGQPSPVLEVELLENCRRGLSAVKCPQGIVFVASLPRTLSGRPDLSRLWAVVDVEVGA